MSAVTNKPVRDSTPDSATAKAADHPWRRFVRHYIEMTVVMVVGMVVAVTIFMYAFNFFVRPISWEAALVVYPVHALTVVAIGMSLPMIPWMQWRGHSRRSAYEMAAVMAVPVLPFLGLAVLEIVKGAMCGLYCIASLVAMAALMV